MSAFGPRFEQLAKRWLKLPRFGYSPALEVPDAIQLVVLVGEDETDEALLCAIQRSTDLGDDVGTSLRFAGNDQRTFFVERIEALYDPAALTDAVFLMAVIEDERLAAAITPPTTTTRHFRQERHLAWGTVNDGGFVGTSESLSASIAPGASYTREFQRPGLRIDPGTRLYFGNALASPHPFVLTVWYRVPGGLKL